MNWGDRFVGAAFPLALLIIAVYVMLTLMFQSPLAVQP